MKMSEYVEKRNTCYYYYNATTKNEKGVSKNGRLIPITNKLYEVLHALKENQENLNITSEWLFCDRTGNWITTKGYSSALRKMAIKLGYNITNNHALRIALNSYEYIPLGLTVTERAKLLGHSVSTNLNRYTFSLSDDYMGQLTDKLNGGHSRSPKIIQFQPKRKSQETVSF